MSHGVIATLPELIKLEQVARGRPPRIRAKAARSGDQASLLRGRGMDFTDVRHYQIGDEIRHMEWRSTARTGKPHIKLYQEERERPIVLLVDFNPSMYFGTRVAFKSVLAARLASLIAWMSASEGDRIGGFIFSGGHHQEFIPRSRKAGVLPLLAGLADYTSILHREHEGEPRPLVEALKQLRHVLKPGSLLVLISDFYTLDAACEPLISRIKQHNDVLAYHINDSLELAPPAPGLYPVTDGTRRLRLNTRDKRVHQAYTTFAENHLADVEQRFKRFKTPCIALTADSDWVNITHQTFPRRSHG
ncbi:MAG: DUF58 domain-containing protein [Legionellaceae bacterium]|nr:DUF58 domain-containing protein [Legionellaceae bacterium]